MDAYPGLCHGYRKCWIEEAYVTEQTAQQRERPDGDKLVSELRIFAAASSLGAVGGGSPGQDRPGSDGIDPDT